MAMSPTAHQLYETALTLPDDEREELATRLLDSLNGSPEDVAAAWDAEIKRRVEAAQRGEGTFLSHDEVWQRLDAKYGKLAD
jgi:putative addiction module component (TIGR02574 family)